MAGAGVGGVSQASLPGGSSGLPAGFPLPQRPRAGGGNGALGCCSCVPSLCLTSCLLPLPAGSEDSGKHSAVGLMAAEGAPDKLSLPTGVGVGSHPGKPCFLRKQLKREYGAGRKKWIPRSKLGILLGSSSQASTSDCAPVQPLPYFIMHQNYLMCFISLNILWSHPHSKF